jgi:uncharacterized glyoxalase superfamily protein PhnB
VKLHYALVHEDRHIGRVHSIDINGSGNVLLWNVKTQRAYGKDPILNLEQGNPATQWGRLIFHVSDVDGFWAYFEEKGLHPESPRDASWGERYFHMRDPDGHELSFARPI